MGGAAMGNKNTEADGNSFPQIVAWCSLVIALLLFFGNTTPAVRERAELRMKAADMQRLRHQLEESIAHALPGTPQTGGAEDDLQSVLVAIDRIGWTPTELLQNYPEPQPRAAVADPDAANAAGNPLDPSEPPVRER
jgi:hypothetical protein